MSFKENPIVTVNVDVNRIVEVDVYLESVLDGLCNCEPIEKWNYLARILNHVVTNNHDAKLTIEQRKVIKEYLENKLKELNELPQPSDA